MSSPANSAQDILKQLLLEDLNLVTSGGQDLLNGALDKVIASNGDINVAAAAFAQVAALAPLTLPTLIPQQIVLGARAAKALLALLKADIAAKLTP